MSDTHVFTPVLLVHFTYISSPLDWESSESRIVSHYTVGAQSMLIERNNVTQMINVGLVQFQTMIPNYLDLKIMFSI